MGQSQLLITILGTLIVGLAIYSAVQLVQANSQASDEDLVKIQMNIVVTEAKKYSVKTASLGGGEGSFTGYKPPNNMLNSDRVTLSGSFVGNIITLQGYGTAIGINGTDPVSVVGVYDNKLGNWQSITRVN